MNKGWGSPSPVEPIENIDNYLAAVEKAKSELADLNLLIEAGRKQFKDIKSGSMELLRSKQETLDNALKKAEAFHSEANQLHAKNSIISEQLDKELQKHSDTVSKFNDDKVAHLKEVQSKIKLIEEQWNSIKAAAHDIQDTKKFAEDKNKENLELLNQIIAENEQQKANAYELDKKIQDHQALVAEANSKLEEAASLKKQAEERHAEASSKLEQCEKVLVEANYAKDKSMHNLNEVKAHKESIKDLIIESKKVAMEAQNTNEIAQRNISEANQKIAELSKLKDALANQEN